MTEANQQDFPAVSATAVDPSQPVPDEFDLRCESCGYSLIGLMSDRCPECGHVFDSGELPLARIPWLFRKQHGILWAYIRTVLMIILHPLKFGREMSRPIRVSAEDAKGFRRLTIRLCLIAATLALVTLVVVEMIILYTSIGRFPVGWHDLVQGLAAFAGGMLALWIFLWLATDLPTFIWKGLPANPMDLAPLHHYAVAPLALLPLGTALAAGIGAVAAYGNGRPDTWFDVSGVSLTVALTLVTLLMLYVPPMLMRGATRCSVARQLLLAAYLPIHWAIIFLLSVLVMGAVAAPFSD